jgi:hypothetical protein
MTTLLQDLRCGLRLRAQAWYRSPEYALALDFCSDALAKMDDSKLAETMEGFGGKQVTRAWIGLVLAGAWADHYAEAAMYLRLNGVLPPTAKK